MNNRGLPAWPSNYDRRLICSSPVVSEVRASYPGLWPYDRDASKAGDAKPAKDNQGLPEWLSYCKQRLCTPLAESEVCANYSVFWMV